jgi:hypothetical protein
MELRLVSDATVGKARSPRPLTFSPRNVELSCRTSGGELDQADQLVGGATKRFRDPPNPFTLSIIA